MKPLLHSVAYRVNQLIRPAGIRIDRDPPPHVRRRRALMRSHRISAVIDVGANIGQYGQLLRQHGYQGRIESYEPLPQEYRALEKRCAADRLWTAHNLAVDATPGTVTMHIAANSESSSMLQMLRRHLEAEERSHTVGNVTARAITLEEILSGVRDETVMLKIDTQGNEPRVLEGGRALLTDVRLLEIELSLVPLYEGQLLFRDIDALLLQRGFSLVSLQEGFFDEATGELLQMDGIYANTGRA